MTDVVWDGVVVRHGPGIDVGPATLTARSGRVLGLVGANGAGKTTLLKALCGLLPAASGRVLVGGVPVVPGRMPAGVSAMIEEPAFVLRATGLENLTLAAGGRAGWLGRRAAVLDEVDLTGRAGEAVAGYSQGMRQRLGLARVLLAGAPVVVLDEPTNGLDPQGIRWIRDLVGRLRAQGRTVVLSSHLLAEVQVLADDVAVMSGRRLLAAGPAEQVIAAESTLEEFYFERLALGGATGVDR